MIDFEIPSELMSIVCKSQLINNEINEDVLSM